MGYSCRNRGIWLFGLVTALLAVSLAVVVPIHLNQRFFPACTTAHAGLRAAHHTVVDQLDGRLDSRIDRAGRAAVPGRLAAAMLFALDVPSATPRTTAAPPRRARMLRHLRIAPSHADDGDPPSHTASLHV
jgi:hypothetical protein